MQNKNIFQSRSQYLEVVKELYSELSKNKAGKKFPWFIIRIQTAYFFHLIYGGKIKVEDNQTKINTEKKEKSLIERIKNSYIKSKLLLKILKLQFELQGRLKGKTLFLADFVHNIKEKKFNPYIHPFINNDDATIIYFTHKQKNKIEDLLYVLVEYYKLDQSDFERQSNLEVSSEVLSYLHKNHDIYSAELFKILNKNLNEYSVNLKAYKKFIKILKPERIFSYVYYNANVNAMFYVANMENIETVEYQHSSISDNHFAYSRWEDSDDISFHFPKTFYVWSTEDKSTILKNFSGKKYIPNLKIVGNKHLEQTKDSIVSKESSEISKNILICLQGQWIPSFLEDFISKDNQYKWYFRLHPRYPQDKNRLVEFSKNEKRNLVIEKANSLELYDLFSEVSIIITSFSGTALEAEQLGKKILIFGEEGATSYKQKIEDGIFNFVSDGYMVEKHLKSFTLTDKSQD